MMTLILNCLTHDYVFQVSDRRLVKINAKGKVLGVVDDHANKAVFYCGHISFGYTGLAEINGQGSDRWLLEKLPTSFENFHTTIKQEATDEFKKCKLPATLKRHAFAGIGWIRVEKTGPLYPSVVSISNFQNKKGEFLRSASESFDVHAFRLPDDIPLAIYPIGATVKTTVLKRLYRNIMKCLEEKTSYKEILRLITFEMREIAKSDETVGSNLMAVGMPKSAAGSGLGTPIKGIEDYSDNMNIFLYLPADSSEEVIYSPHVKYYKFTQADLTYEHRDGNFISEFSMNISSTAPDHFNTGMDLCKKNQYKDAMIEFDKAIELQPDLAEAWTGKGIVFDELGESEKALETFEYAIELKKDLVFTWISKGVTLGKLGQLNKALESFDKATNIKSDDPDAWYYKGFALAKNKQFKDAHKAFTKATELNPKSSKAWTSKGVTLEILGQLDEAIEAFGEALKLNSIDGYALYYTARLYARKGDKTNALSSLSKAINNNGMYKERAKKDQDFKSLSKEEDFKKLVI